MSAKRRESRLNFDKPGILPRSIGKTLAKLKSDFAPNAEAEMIERFRISRQKTVTSIRYLLIIILIPFLVNQISKTYIFEPLIEDFWTNEQAKIFLNSSQSERALAELKRFEEKIRFEVLIGKTPNLSPEVTEKKLKEKAT